MHNRRSLLSFIGIETTALLLPAFAFLTWYVTIHGAPIQAIPSHLELIVIALSSMVAIRTAFWCSGIPAQLSRTASALLIAIFIVASSTYYSLVAAGIYYWGRVISLELVQGYSWSQFPYLLDILDISYSLAIFALVVPVVLIGLISWKHVHRQDWTQAASTCGSRSTTLVVCIAILGISFFRLVEFYGDPPLHQQEPLALTFLSKYHGVQFQGLLIVPERNRQFNQWADDARSEYLPATDIEKRNIVLIVVDALRPDRMGVLDADRATTPFLSSLDARNFFSLKSSVYSACAESACGLLAMISSRYPHEFSTRPVTLNEILIENDYEVHLRLSGDHTNFYQLNQLYGPHSSYLDGSDFDGYINDDLNLVKLVEEMDPWNGNPTMFQFHLMSAHSIGKRNSEAQPFEPATNYAIRGIREPKSALNFYDNGVYQTDFVIERILKTLESKGYLQNAVVGITADHGEMLGEHGFWSHANTVHENALRIPFLLIPSWNSPADETLNIEIGSQVDIGPSILSAAGIPIPNIWSGSPLQGTREQKDLIYFRQSNLVGLVDTEMPGFIWKYWIDLQSNQEYLFNILRDPQEACNLIANHPTEKIGSWRNLIRQKSGNIASLPSSLMTPGEQGQSPATSAQQKQLLGPCN